MSTKISINIRLDKEIKKLLDEKAKCMGTTMSNIFNMYAHKFVETGELEYLEKTNKCSNEDKTTNINKKIIKHFKK